MAGAIQAETERKPGLAVGEGSAPRQGAGGLERPGKAAKSADWKACATPGSASGAEGTRELMAALRQCVAKCAQESLAKYAEEMADHVCEEMGARLAEWAAGQKPFDAEAALAKIFLRIDAVGKEYKEMRTAKERLEQMQREKLFAFADHIDAESFRILCAVLAHGDVAKASRALNMSDPTLRSRMREWREREGPYQVLLELVRWRKAIGRRGTVPLHEAILHMTAASVDYAGLLADLLEGLLEMNAGNWEEKAEELADLLRPHVPR
jgi:hypothetical protein